MSPKLPGFLCLVLFVSAAVGDDDVLFKRFRSGFVRIDGKFIEVPKFDLRFDNSARLTKEEAIKLAKGAVVGEQFAADRRMKALPAVQVGEFGEIDSFQVDKVRGNDDLIISKIPYGVAALDKKSRIRLNGMPTKGMVDDRRYNHTVSIAIIGTWNDGSSKTTSVQLWSKKPRRCSRNCNNASELPRSHVA